MRGKECYKMEQICISPSCQVFTFLVIRKASLYIKLCMPKASNIANKHYFN